MYNINILNIFIESICHSFTFLINIIILCSIYFNNNYESSLHNIYLKLNKYLHL